MTDQGIEVVSFATFDLLVAAQAVQAFAAIMVDDTAPRLDERLARLQPKFAAQTALIVVGEGGAASISRALLLGADDYAITCERATEHLVQRAIARVSVKLRGSQKRMLSVGSYRLLLAEGVLYSTGGQVRLTPRELTLARLLFERCNQVVTSETLCDAICGRVDASAERAVQQHAYELRRKLQQVVPRDGQALRIVAMYGAGYRLAW
ncbi:winged helix-turn-helix domain-containing protein [Piscinibacter sp. XHJ-5]|uniref:winged helix-turn-helix domain-containing protein n=1 Tax=Piscinibacter sp. XHJ-5 TaxID=3037797 RepID=UPI002452EA30|nr:winged helix-turn-helix domain-containing protein [Piscinibacter sp. XHJ-5]